MKQPIKNNELKQWALWGIILLLQRELDSLHKSNNQSGNTGNGSGRADNGGEPTQPESVPFAPERPNEPAVVYFKPSFVGYLNAAWRLFKEAFCNKKRHNFIVMR